MNKIEISDDMNDIERRFWEKVNMTLFCWEWTGAKQSEGYGVVKVSGTAHLAHRVSYVMHHGELKDREVVLHSCDNPLCIHPDHLSKGSQLQNMQDMIRKGRKAKPLQRDDNGRFC